MFSGCTSVTLYVVHCTQPMLSGASSLNHDGSGRQIESSSRPYDAVSLLLTLITGLLTFTLAGWVREGFSSLALGTILSCAMFGASNCVHWIYFCVKVAKEEGRNGRCSHWQKICKEKIYSVKGVPIARTLYKVEDQCLR